MQTLDKNEMKSVKGGVIPSSGKVCWETTDCEYCLYFDTWQISKVCVTISDV